MNVGNKLNGPGVYLISNKDYHLSDGISNTHLVQISKTPAHYQAWLQAPREETDEMKLGKLVHAMVLEPATIPNEYLVAPKLDKRTKEGKELWAKIQAEAQGRDLVRQDVFLQAEKIAERYAQKIAADPIYGQLLTGLKEHSFYWKDEQTGIVCRCRPDVLTKNGIITDLKVTGDANRFQFNQSIVRNLYFMQAAWYIDGVRQALRQSNETLPEGYQMPETFVLAPAERELPHEIALYELSETAIDHGRVLYRRLLDRYARCLKASFWPGYSLEIKKVDLPSWGYDIGSDE